MYRIRHPVSRYVSYSSLGVFVPALVSTSRLLTIADPVSKLSYLIDTGAEISVLPLCPGSVEMLQAVYNYRLLTDHLSVHLAKDQCN